LLPALRPGSRAILLLRDGQAPAALAAWLAARGCGASTLRVLEARGGPRQRLRPATAAGFDLRLTRPPVAVGLLAAGGVARRAGPGLPDDAFQHDGQITRAPVRALTLAALAPRPGALLWDLGAGSGSVAVEWALAGGRAVAVERRADRFGNIIANIKGFGLSETIAALHSDSIAALPGLPDPDAVFVGGGLTEALAAALWARIPPGTTLVA